MSALRLHRVDATVGHVWADIVRMDADCFGAEAPALSHNRGAWWVLKDGKKSVAFCGIEPSYRTELGGYLSRAGVLRSHRGHGIQKQLIRTRVDYARTQGWTQVVSDTCENPASSNSLISCGFRIFAPENPWSFKHAIYWKKFLLK